MKPEKSAPAPKERLRKVQFDTPGVIAIGPYRPKQAYDVPEKEAARLVAHKGFRYVDDASAAPAMNHEES